MSLHNLSVKLVLSWMLVWLFALPAAAEDVAAKDEILLKNGSRLIGEVVDARDGKVTIKTDFAGELRVALDQIVSVNTEDPMVVLLEDESVVEGKSLAIQEEEVVLAGTGQPYPLAQLSVVNPQPWELGEGYRWKGVVSAALVRERGNTDTDEWDYKLNSVWRSTQDRYTLNAVGELDETDGTKTADNWQVTGKYDYFLADPNYVGLLGFVQKDKFQDLDLRYLIGPYFGRQFYDKPVFSFSGEFGFSYVVEEFNVAEDDEYAASNWTMNASSNYLGGDSSLYFDQLGVWNLEDTSDVIVNTTFGLSFPLFMHFEAAAEVLFEYDSGSVDNVDDLDQTYRFRVGYKW